MNNSIASIQGHSPGKISLIFSKGKTEEGERDRDHWNLPEQFIIDSKFDLKITSTTLRQIIKIIITNTKSTDIHRWPNKLSFTGLVEPRCRIF